MFLSGCTVGIVVLVGNELPSTRRDNRFIYRALKESKLHGQAMISYLQKKGFPDVRWLPLLRTRGWCT